MGANATTLSSDRAGRLRSLQAMRALAALLVVWGHSIECAGWFSVPTQSQFFHWGHFGPCGVDIFFVISGFVVSQVAARVAIPDERRKHPGMHFLSRRITRIFPLFWILTGVMVLQGVLGHHKIKWHEIHWLTTIFLIPAAHYPADAPLLPLGWTLMFELYFYLVLTAFMKLSPRFLIRNTMLFLSTAVFLGMLIGIRRPILVVVSNPMVVEFIFGCILGLLVAQLRQANANVHYLGRGLAILGIVSLTATIFTGYGTANDAFRILAGYDCWLRVGVWGIPSAFLVGGAILWNPAMVSPAARLLVFLGDASYSIYLCTMPARSVVAYFWRQFSMWGVNTGVFLGAVFCTLVGVVCYLAIERPLMRFFHNWYKPLPFKVPA